jgi:preprotein translocase subunit SecF
MWMIGWLPDALLAYAVNILLVVGAVSAFLSFFIIHRIVRWVPALAPYHLLLQIISAVLLVAGLYFKGGLGVEMQWRERVAELEAKVQEAEAKAKVVNEVVVVKYRDRVKTVVETKVVIQEKIKEVEKIVDGQCKVAPEAVFIHNEAAKMPERNKK